MCLAYLGREQRGVSFNGKERMQEAASKEPICIWFTKRWEA
jgi:hypothetical protein